MWNEWINEKMNSLPGTDDVLFRNVWEKHRLLFDGRSGIEDIIDFNSARLVASALRTGKRLLVILPDLCEHRPAFLFATALIRYFLDTRHQSGFLSRPVLYFGPYLGIREQLHRTSVQGLGVNLAQVFSQQDIRRGATSELRLDNISSSRLQSLPHVITVYSPADPARVLQDYRPCWIAVDCSDAGSMAWLKPLLHEVAKQEIPVVAWGQNAFSECVSDFNMFGYTFTWPLNSPVTKEFEHLLGPREPINLEPIVMRGRSVQRFSSKLSSIYRILIDASQEVTKKNRFQIDAVLLHWRYFRTLESMFVPVDFFEAEAQRFWGLKSLRTISSACSHFRNSLVDSGSRLHSILEEASSLLHEVQDDLENLGCGLWSGLVNLCLEDTFADKARIIVFPNESKKQLFLFAMLARYNTTEDDLREIGNYITSLSELASWTHFRTKSTCGNPRDQEYDGPPINIRWYPILVGLPSSAYSARLIFPFFNKDVSIVLYPHQCSSLMQKQIEWSLNLNGNWKGNIDAICGLLGIGNYGVHVNTSERIKLLDPIDMNVESSLKSRGMLPQAIWEPDDPVAEVSRLFEIAAEYENDETITFRDNFDNKIASNEDLSEEIWCSEAFLLQFEQGWYAYFAPDDMVNIIGNGSFDLRYIRSVRANEYALLIHGQRRQNLYDLIISRVHRHPSIELHLAMIRRWQEDLRVAYAQWREEAGDLNGSRKCTYRDTEDLLCCMKRLGSTLTSSAALNLWLNGSVLCPQDPEDLRRVGEILNMKFVLQHYRRISQAASRLRGLHRGLSNKLNRWLQEQIAGVIQSRDDDVIDNELGLTFGDLRNSLLILQIKKMQVVQGPFLRSSLGRIEKEISK